MKDCNEINYKNYANNPYIRLMYNTPPKELDLAGDEEFVENLISSYSFILVIMSIWFVGVNLFLIHNHFNYLFTIIVLLCWIFLRTTRNTWDSKSILWQIYIEVVGLDLLVFIVWGGDPFIVLAGICPIVFMNLVMFKNKGIVISAGYGFILIVISIVMDIQGFGGWYNVTNQKSIFYFFAFVAIMIFLVFLRVIWINLNSLYTQTHQFAEKYKILVDESPDGLGITNDKGIFLEVNNSLANFTGIDQSQIIGTDGHAFRKMAGGTIIQDYFQCVLKHGKYHIESQFTIGNTTKYYELVGNRLQDGRIFHQLRDRTSKVEQDQKIKAIEEIVLHNQKFEVVGKLAGQVAHDFNNVLTAITNYAEVLLLDSKEGKVDTTHIEEIRRASLRGSTITKSLLSSASTKNSVVQPVNLNYEILIRKEMIESLLGPSIQLNLFLSDEICNVLIDQIQFEQILLNLILNSKDAIYSEGEITLSTYRDTLTVQEDELIIQNQIHPFREYIVFSIQDTGSGIPSDSLETVFEPFYSNKSNGTGLGLYIVQSIMDQFKGVVKIDSQVGIGTSFYLYFKPTEADVIEEPSTVYLKPDWCQTALIIDDQAGVRSAISATLRRIGIDVTTTHDAQEAQTLIQNENQKYDIIVTDLVMPSLRGDKFIQWLRKYDKDTYVILMTGYDNQLQELKNYYQSDKRTMIVIKPFRISEILGSITQV